MNRSGTQIAALTNSEFGSNGDLISRNLRVISEASELLGHLDKKRVTWINIVGLGDLDVLRVLGERFHLHPLALEDVLETGQRPNAEQYDDYLFIVAQMLYLDAKSQMCGEQVSMFLGKRFLITLQEEADFDFRSGAGTHPLLHRAHSEGGS